MYTLNDSHLVCFGHTCMKDDSFMEMVVAISIMVLFSLPILLALS